VRLNKFTIFQPKISQKIISLIDEEMYVELRVQHISCFWHRRQVTPQRYFINLQTKAI